MLNRFFAAILITTLFLSELPANAQQSPAPPATTATPAAPSTVVVPTGTVIPLNLLTSIPGRTKSAGQAIRAQVAFPIIVGDQVVIPANTFVDGTLDYVTPPTSKNKHPNTVIHFKTLTFANGYTVPLPTNDISQLVLPNLAPRPGLSPVRSSSNSRSLAHLQPCAGSRPRSHARAAVPNAASARLLITLSRRHHRRRRWIIRRLDGRYYPHQPPRQ